MDFTLIHSDALLIDRSRLQHRIKQEMRLLKAPGRRPSRLEHPFNALLSITPRSVEAEPAFPAARLFATITTK